MEKYYRIEVGTWLGNLVEKKRKALCLTGIVLGAAICFWGVKGAVKEISRYNEFRNAGIGEVVVYERNGFTSSIVPAAAGASVIAACSYNLFRRKR